MTERQDSPLLKFANAPIRVKSANGQPAPKTSIERRCESCGASFLGLAFGLTGLVGIWQEWGWYCSTECRGRAER